MEGGREGGKHVPPCSSSPWPWRPARPRLTAPFAWAVRKGRREGGREGMRILSARRRIGRREGGREGGAYLGLLLLGGLFTGGEDGGAAVLLDFGLELVGCCLWEGGREEGREGGRGGG